MSIDIQRKIHSIQADSLEPMYSKLRRQITAAQPLDNRYKDALLKKLDAISYKSMLCHGDFHLFNLIMSEQNDQVNIIDWVDATTGDYRADIYRTFLLYDQVSTELANLYLNMYCQKSGLSKEEIMQWAPIIAGARLSENVSLENRQHLLKIVHSSISL